MWRGMYIILNCNIKCIFSAVNYDRKCIFYYGFQSKMFKNYQCISGKKLKFYLFSSQGTAGKMRKRWCGMGGCVQCVEGELRFDLLSPTLERRRCVSSKLRSLRAKGFPLDSQFIFCEMTLLRLCPFTSLRQK